MDKKPQIITYLEGVAPFIPFPIYWGDAVTLKVLGANQSCLEAMGAKVPEDVIGKTPYDYYPKDIADNIIEHVKKVVAEKKTLSQEDVIQDITTGKTRYYSAIRSPLFASNSTKVVGIIGTSVEITAEKEAEQLRAQVARHQAVAEEQVKFQGFVEQLLHVINGYQISALNHKLGKSQAEIIAKIAPEIVLTPREKEVLYYLNLNMTPKEIATVLSITSGKEMKPKSVQAVIDKQLYPKFDVYSVSQLIEKANLLKLTPFLL